MLDAGVANEVLESSLEQDLKKLGRVDRPTSGRAFSVTKILSNDFI